MLYNIVYIKGRALGNSTEWLSLTKQRDSQQNLSLLSYNFHYLSPKLSDVLIHGLIFPVSLLPESKVRNLPGLFNDGNSTVTRFHHYVFNYFYFTSVDVRIYFQCLLLFFITILNSKLQLLKNSDAHNYKIQIFFNRNRKHLRYQSSSKV